MGCREVGWSNTAVHPQSVKGGEEAIVEAQQTSDFWVCLEQIKPVGVAAVKPFMDDGRMLVWIRWRTEDVRRNDHAEEIL